jgi:hypothetical protein
VSSNGYGASTALEVLAEAASEPLDGVAQPAFGDARGRESGTHEMRHIASPRSAVPRCQEVHWGHGEMPGSGHQGSPKMAQPHTLHA